MLFFVKGALQERKNARVLSHFKSLDCQQTLVGRLYYLRCLLCMYICMYVFNYLIHIYILE